MTDAGITRRIDDLGRIVIPKELRGKLGIKEGDPLMFFTDNGKLVLERYESRETKLEKWLKEVEFQMRTDSGDFMFYQRKNVTVCVYCGYDRRYYDGLTDTDCGIAICSPNDRYSDRLGRALSYARAVEYPIPDFIYEND